MVHIVKRSANPSGCPCTILTLKKIQAFTQDVSAFSLPAVFDVFCTLLLHLLDVVLFQCRVILTLKRSISMNCRGWATRKGRIKGAVKWKKKETFSYIINFRAGSVNMLLIISSMKERDVQSLCHQSPRLQPSRNDQSRSISNFVIFLCSRVQREKDINKLWGHCAVQSVNTWGRHRLLCPAFPLTSQKKPCDAKKHWQQPALAC